MPIVQESLLLARIHPKPDVQAADEGGNDSSDPESQSSSDIASDDEDDQLTRLLQVWAKVANGLGAAHESKKTVNNGNA